MTDIAISAPIGVRRAIVTHARRDRPRECCGFLVGSGRRVRHAVPMPNVAPGETRYRVDDRAHIELRKLLRQFAPPLGIVGVYHSHPNGRAEPSPSDVAEAMYPEWIHVIVGLGGGAARVRAFRIARGRVRPVAVCWQAASGPGRGAGPRNQI